MIRITIFVIAVLLAVQAIEPSGPWLVTLAVLAGLELVRWRPFRSRPRLPSWRRSWAEECDW